MSTPGNRPHGRTGTKHALENTGAGHKWFTYKALEVCKNCGVVRRADDKNSKCKGHVKVKTR